jgi:hypothetical protein
MGRSRSRVYRRDQQPPNSTLSDRLALRKGVLGRLSSVRRVDHAAPEPLRQGFWSVPLGDPHTLEYTVSRCDVPGWATRTVPLAAMRRRAAAASRASAGLRKALPKRRFTSAASQEAVKV